MTFKDIPALLAAKPELEALHSWVGNDDRQILRKLSAEDCLPAAQLRRDYVLDADAAILEVANAAGTCGECAHWTPYPVQEAFGPRRGACYEEVVVFSEGDTAEDFGCSLFNRRSQP